MGDLLAPGPGTVDEEWQLSKDSADAATVIRWIEREKGKSRIKTVTEVLLTPALLLLCQTKSKRKIFVDKTGE